MTLEKSERLKRAERKRNAVAEILSSFGDLRSSDENQEIVTNLHRMSAETLEWLSGRAKLGRYPWTTTSI